MRYALHILFLLLVPPAFAQRLISVATDTNGVISVPYTFWPSNAVSAWSAWGMTNAGIPYHLGSGRFMPLTIGSGLSTNGWVLSATNGGVANITTNGSSAGNPVTLQPDLSLATTNVLTVSTQIVDVLVLTEPLSIANGGTGTNSAAAALSNLGGQPLDADLTLLSAIGLATNGWQQGWVLAFQENGSLGPTNIDSGDGLVSWTNLVDVPAGFADGTDDGGAGSSWTNLTDIPSAISALSTNNGAALTNLNGSNIALGTVAEARIDAAIARDSEMALLYQPTNGNLTTVSSLTGGTSTNFLSGDGTFKQVTTNMVTGLVGDLSNLSTYAGTHLTEAEASALYQATNSNLTLLSTNNASSLTNLNASNLASGTVPDARLSSSVALTNSPTLHTPSIIGATTQTGAASNQVSYGAPILYAGTTNIVAELATKKSTRTGVIREIWVPANAMSPGSDTPTASTNIWATTTDGQRIETWDFSATATNSLYFTLTLPQAWDASTLKAKVHWKQVAAEANTTNVWAIGGGSINDGEEGGNTLGTLVTVLDQGLNNTNQVAISPASSAITIGGTPSAGHLTWFTVRRHPGDSSDNMSVVSRLFGVHLQYTETSTEPSAW